MSLLEPKHVVIQGRNFILSKFPATAGREIVSKYPLSAIPKLGDYGVNEETMFKLMSYVAVDLGNNNIQTLITRQLIDQHTGDWETLIRVEKEMLTYNCSFFQNGEASTLLKGFAQKLPQSLTRILTDSLQQLSQTSKQPSES
jgi:hypothetical protein